MSKNVLLSKECARELIEYIAKTNFEVAPYGDGLFNNAEEAIIYLNKQYDPTFPFALCYPLQSDPDYWDSAIITQQGNVWYAYNDDYQFESHTLKGLIGCIEAITDVMYKPVKCEYVD